MGQMIEDFYYGYSLEFDLLLKEYFKFIPKFKVKKRTLESLNIDFHFLYGSSMTEQEINKFLMILSHLWLIVLQSSFLKRFYATTE